LSDVAHYCLPLQKSQSKLSLTVASESVALCWMALLGVNDIRGSLKDCGFMT